MEYDGTELTAMQVQYPDRPTGATIETATVKAYIRSAADSSDETDVSSDRRH